MKTENEIYMRNKPCGCSRAEKMPLVEMKDTLDNGGRVTLLIRHAERPPLDPGDLTFGASLSLTESGWRWAHNFGLMLANNLLPKSAAFYASETFRTLQTACAMAMGLDLVGTGQSIECKVRLAPFLGSESSFFGSVEKAHGTCRRRKLPRTTERLFPHREAAWIQASPSCREEDGSASERPA